MIFIGDLITQYLAGQYHNNYLSDLSDNPCFSPSTPPKYQAVILTMFTQMALIYLPRDRGKENIVNFEMYEGFSFGCLTYQILAVKSCLGKAVYIVFQMFQNIDKNFSLTG